MELYRSDDLKLSTWFVHDVLRREDIFDSFLMDADPNYETVGRALGMFLLHGVNVPEVRFPLIFYALFLNQELTIEDLQGNYQASYDKFQRIAVQEENPDDETIDGVVWTAENKHQLIHDCINRISKYNEAIETFQFMKVGFQMVIDPTDLSNLSPADLRDIMRGENTEIPENAISVPELDDAVDPSADEVVPLLHQLVQVGDEELDLDTMLDGPVIATTPLPHLAWGETAVPEWWTEDYMEANNLLDPDDDVVQYIRMYARIGNAPKECEFWPVSDFASFTRRAVNSITTGSIHVHREHMCQQFGPIGELPSLCPELVSENNADADTVAHRKEIRMASFTIKMLCSHEGTRTLEIDRAHLFANSTEYLMDNGFDFNAFPWLKISFTSETGVDAGGVFKDWATSYAELLIETKEDITQQLFVVGPDRLLHVNPRYRVPENFIAVGRFLGLILRHNVQVSLEFPTLYYARFLGRKLDVEDIRTEDPQAYQGYQGVLAMEENTFEDEIADEIWTVENRNELIQEAINKFTSEDVDCGVELMAFGMGDAVREITWLQRDDIRSLIAGDDSDVSVADLSVNTMFSGGLSADHQSVVWLWEVLTEMTQENIRKFLYFATGSSRVPVGGFKNMSPKLTVRAIDYGQAAADEQHLPVGHTCLNILDLPIYASKEVMRAKLMLALISDPAMGTA